MPLYYSLSRRRLLQLGCCGIGATVLMARGANGLAGGRVIGVKPLVRLGIHSDLHNEYSGARIMPDFTGADVVVLAGDIDHGTKSTEYAVAVAEKHNVPVILIAGNHEFYGGSYDEVLQSMRDAVALHPLVHFLERDQVTVAGVRFLGCTLWSDFKLYGPAAEHSPEFYQRYAEKHIQDFRQIQYRGRLLQAADIVCFHHSSTRWLRHALTEAVKPIPTVVVTHFAPSIQALAPKWWQKEESRNYAPYFIDNEKRFMRHFNIKAWIYGHTHDNIRYPQYHTQVLCNQRGYPGEKTEYIADYCYEIS